MDTGFLHYRDFNNGTLSRDPFRFLRQLIWRRHRWGFLGIVATTLGGLGAYSMEPLLLRDLVEALRTSPAGQGMGPAATPFALVVGAWLLSAAFNRLQDYVSLWVLPKFRLEVQSLLFSYLMEHSPAFFHDAMAGGIGQQVKQVASAAVALMTVLCNEGVRLVAALLIGIVMLSGFPPIFTWLLLGWAAVFVLTAALLTRTNQRLSRITSEALSRSTGVLVDIVSNAEAVRAFARGAQESARFGATLDVERRTNMDLRRFTMINFMILFTGVILFQAAFFGIAVRDTAEGRMVLGDAVMAFSLGAILGTNVWILGVRLLEIFEHSGVLVAGLNTILQPHGVLDRPEAQPIAVPHGAIAFEDVGFGHRDGQQLFAGLNLVIRPGEKVGLVGPSGAGKSTLVRLLRRHYDLDSGRIVIDGQDIAAVTQDSLNRAIAEVPQDPSLFHRTIAENIAYGCDGEIDPVGAAQRARCHDFILRRPGGYDSVVGERGVRLSGGERQRIAIARAFLKPARILVLDEATSALDSETESAIREALWQLFEGRTVIAIAHRLSTISSMDRILYLEGGQVLEDGSHESLLAKNGRYARLWHNQVDGFVK